MYHKRRSGDRFGVGDLELGQGPLEVGPELVIEVISPSETRRSLTGKLKDYTSIGVQECWIVRSGHQTIEVLQLSPSGPQTIATYGAGDMLRSVTFPDLIVPVAEVFAP